MLNSPLCAYCVSDIEPQRNAYSLACACPFRGPRLCVAAQDPADSFGVWVSPAEAEGVAGRVGVDLVPLDSGEVGGCLQQPGPERNGFGVRALRVVDVQIDVDLLRVPVRPIRRDMVGCELHADHPLRV